MSDFPFHPSFLSFSLRTGYGALSELSSLGNSHVLCSDHCGHASSPTGLYCPPLQLAPRRLQQAVCLLPQEPGKRGFHPRRRDAVHPRQEPEWSPLSHAKPPGVPGPWQHLSSGAHHQLYLHQRLRQRLPDQPRSSQIWVMILQTTNQRLRRKDEKVQVLITP